MWVLVNECWEVVHDCDVDKLLGRVDHMQEGVQVMCPTRGTEWSGGGLCVRERSEGVEGWRVASFPGRVPGNEASWRGDRGQVL